MECIIIDDEQFARTIISEMVSKENDLVVKQQFSNPVDAIKFLNMENQSVDLIFLDIHMPYFTGFDFIKTLKNTPDIILVTSDKNYALHAFEYSCIVDYIVKPITEKRFRKSVKKAKNRRNKDSVYPTIVKENNTELTAESEFYINIDKRLIKINIPKINIIEAKGDYIQIKTETKNYTVHSTLKNILKKLPSSLFLKIHRAYIINIKKIIDIEDNSVLISKEIVPISRANRTALMERVNTL